MNGNAKNKSSPTTKPTIGPSEIAVNRARNHPATVHPRVTAKQMREMQPERIKHERFLKQLLLLLILSISPPCKEYVV